MLALVILWAMSLIDAISTHCAIRTGLVWEVNPFMRYCYNVSPWLFFAVKTVLITAACAAFWRAQESIAARWSARAAAWLYAALLGLHAYFWFMYWTGLVQLIAR